MARRGIARVLAPLALVACGIALYTVITHTKGDDKNTSSNKASATPTPSSKAARARARKKFYKVQKGDTASGIAERYNVTVQDLVSLNKKLDPTNLSPGQRIRLRR